MFNATVDDILQSLQMPPVSVKVVQIEDPLADLKEFIVDYTVRVMPVRLFWIKL